MNVDEMTLERLEDYIRTKERVIAGGNALSPGERRSLAQARKELKALTSKNQGVAEGSLKGKEFESLPFPI